MAGINHRSSPTHLHMSVLAPSSGKCQKYKWDQQLKWLLSFITVTFYGTTALFCRMQAADFHNRCLIFKKPHPWHNGADSVWTYCACLDESCLPFEVYEAEEGVDKRRREGWMEWVQAAAALKESRQWWSSWTLHANIWDHQRKQTSAMFTKESNHQKERNLSR